MATCTSLAAFAFLIAVAAPAPAADTASGSVKLGKADWKVADGIAYQDDDEIEVVFSDQAFDKADFRKDGKVDTFDVMGHEGNTLAINVDADGPTMCLDVSTRTADSQMSGSSCNSAFPPAITISSRTDTRIAGSMDYTGDDGDKVKLAFDLPIESGGGAAGTATAPKGEALPANGGEPGKAVVAHFAAVNSGDWAKLKSVSHPERRKQMEASEKDGSYEEMFGFLQAMSPKNPKVTGGRLVDPDNAQVDYTADGGEKGTAEVVRFEGKWYVMGTTSNG